MKVELWSDVICSFCGIADVRIREALSRLGHEDEIEFVHHHYLLQPDHPEGEHVPFASHFPPSMPSEQIREAGRRVEEMAREDGLEPYHVVENDSGNTTVAHEFLAWAADQGKDAEAWELVHRRHWSQKAPLWTIDDVAPFATELGLDEGAARAALASREYRERVVRDHREALALGAQGVPFLVIDRKYGVPGAQPVETFVRALEQAWAQRGEDRS